jgi:CHAT domain-containing protein
VGRALKSGDGSLIEGGAFSDDRVQARTDLADYRVLYFATHGLLPRPGGCLPQPALVTSLGGGGSDALLDATEILDLKLDADLVVLSACDTGGGGAFDQGVADVGGSLGGLTRAFIYAGARGLVVSHWQVDSQATTRLMVGMFGSPNASQAQALRASELSLMNSQDQYSHPYYWAAFTVVGDGARPMPAPAN